MKIKRKKGSILAFTVILMAFMLVIAIALTFSSLRGRKSINVSSNSTTAFQKTDKGMEVFLYELFKNSKPFYTLSELSESMGTDYVCEIVSDSNKKTAVIAGNDFKMISYKEVNPDSNEGNKYKAVDSCDIEIARISKLKVTGNFSNAVRSLEVNLSNILQRGRIARWNFEDNVRSIRLFGNKESGAPEATDSSKEGAYTLTLCPIEDGVTNGGKGSPNTLPRTKESKNCPLLTAKDGSDGSDPAGFYMSHLPKWDDNHESRPDKEGKCYWEKEGIQIPCGTYVAGVYYDVTGGAYTNNEGAYDSRKGAGTGSFQPIAYDLKPGAEGYYSEEGRTGSEALEFNGFSQFLGPNLDNQSGAENYIKEGSRETLNLDDSEGMSISLWVNDNSETGDEEKEILVSKTSGKNSGYELYLKDGKVYFRVNGRTTSADLGSNQWHHIVARYDNSNKGGRNGILIDGKFQQNSVFNAAGAVKDNADTPLFIGGTYEGSSKKFDIDKFEGAFGGMLDNVEIYNRYLIDFEAEALCNMAAGDDWMLSSHRVSKLCKSIEW